MEEKSVTLADKNDLPRVAAVCACALAAMYPVLSAGFIAWDETGYILENPLIKSLSLANIKSIFMSADLKLYTPLTTLSFAFDYQLFGMNAHGFHLTNLVLHILNSALVYFFIKKLCPGNTAVMAGLLFAVHPLHVESVAWIAERKDVLYSFFFLLASLAYLNYRDTGSKKTYAVSLALFLLSLLAKPMAVTLPVILLLCDWFLDGKITRARVKDKAPFFALTALIALKIMSPGHEEAGFNLGAGARVMAPLYNLSFYILKLFVPVNLSAVYIVPEGGMRTIALYAAAAVLVMAAVAVYGRKNRVLLFGLAYYCVSLLPVMQLLPFGPFISADRYAYMCSVGVFFIIAVFIEERLSSGGAAKKKIAAAIFALAVSILILAARARSLVWADSVTLWSDTAAKQPSPMAYRGLGVSYLQRGDYAEAAANFDRALAGEPGNVRALNNRGYANAMLNRPDAAMRDYQTALGIAPDYAQTYANIAALCFHNGEPEKAVEYSLKAVALKPAPGFFNNLGLYYAALGEAQKSRESFKSALSLDSCDGAANYMMCVSLYKEKNFSEAKTYCSRAARCGYPVPKQLNAFLSAY